VIEISSKGMHCVCVNIECRLAILHILHAIVKSQNALNS